MSVLGWKSALGMEGTCTESTLGALCQNTHTHTHTEVFAIILLNVCGNSFKKKTSNSFFVFKIGILKLETLNILIGLGVGGGEIEKF